MKKIIVQGVITLAVFFTTWFGLAQLDWVKLFKVQQVTDKTEEKLGELFLEIFQQTKIEIKNPFVVNSIDSLVTKICTANHIDREYIKVHILQEDDINAFALPNGYILIYSGLILNSDNQEELSGVISHEIAHIELNHIMKKLVKEMGLSVLISMTTGNGGTEIIKEAAKMLSSTAYDRSLEREADKRAVDYLIEAKINPEPFADFLYKLSTNEGRNHKYLNWISTHPDSKERAEYIVEYSSNRDADYTAVLSDLTWGKVKEELAD
jgi:beta-barrel assembly-enhancing protease